PFTRAALQRLMWEHAGVHRSGEGLAAAADQLAYWIAARAEATESTPLSTPPSVPLSVAEREDSNLLDLAQLIVGSALQRRESRGAHFRSDFPEQSPEFARHIVRAREVFALC
ncbi:MAG: nadB, partial [Glaciihabitans sp.]|nr:nadB [Glaciihabitans sp.]